MSGDLPAVPERRLEAVRPLPPAIPENDAPQWAMVGIQTASGVLVLASTTLTQADLTRKVLPGFDPGPLGARLPRWEIRLDCRMKDFVQVRGETYQDAIRSLFEIWSPDRVR